MIALLSYFFITVRETDLKNVSQSESGLFVNILTANDKYSPRSGEILPQPIQMQLSEKQINFSEFFTQFLRSTSIFEHFQNKDDPLSSYISENTECK